MFSLTLPSNSSMALFPDNTLSDYTTQLPRDFALVGSWEVAVSDFALVGLWEVAVSEIMYLNTWKNIADGREYYLKVGIPNEADLKLHLKTGHYKYPEDILSQLARSLDRKLKKRPLRTSCLTASILEKLRSALQNLSSSGLAKNSDSCWALKRVTSINRGFLADGYLWTFIKVCTPSTFTATCWSIALSAIHLLLYRTRGRATRRYGLSSIRKNAILPSAKEKL